MLTTAVARIKVPGGHLQPSGGPGLTALAHSLGITQDPAGRRWRSVTCAGEDLDEVVGEWPVRVDEADRCSVRIAGVGAAPG